jgi:hypothetical protein
VHPGRRYGLTLREGQARGAKISVVRRPALLVSAVLLAAGCGGDDAAVPRPAPADPPAAGPRVAAKPATVRRARCRHDAGNCAAVTGRVVYVEAVDPDGDGDAHYVLAGGSVTAPGLTVIDVGHDLRPRRLPHTGELVSAAGPVYSGSYGQHQIEAVAVHYQRPR